MTCKQIYLGQNWSVEELNFSGLGSIYLAGPKGNSWRFDFIKKIESLGFKVTFFIPELNGKLYGGQLYNGEPSIEESFTWQKSAISSATAVVFWFPKGEIDPQSLVEFGAWCKSERVFLGGNGPEIKYLDWLFHTEQKLNAANSLDQLVERVVHWMMG